MVSLTKASKQTRAKSTTRVVTDAEARKLADEWGLSGEDRDAVVLWLPAVTECRRAVEAELKAMPTSKQLRDALSILEKHLRAIKDRLADPSMQYVGALSAEADDRVVQWKRDLETLMLPLVQEQLRYLTPTRATPVGGRARPQDLKLAESAVDFHAVRLSRTKLSREKFAREVLALAGVAEGSIETLIKQAGPSGVK